MVGRNPGAGTADHAYFAYELNPRKEREVPQSGRKCLTRRGDCLHSRP